MKSISVIKFGGSLTKNEKAKNAFLNELAALSRSAGVVLVHGGGPEINLWLERLGIKSKFVNGLRFTDQKTLEVVEMALSGKVNKELVSGLLKRGVKAVGISGKDGNMVVCKQKKKLGFVGEPYKVNPGIIEVLLKNKFFAVVSSLCADQKGATLNVNADTLATALASALGAEKLIFLTDVAGVLNEKKEVIKTVKIKDIAGLIKKGVITGGMIPKIKACSGAIIKGVKEVWIADGSKGIRKLKGTVIKK